MNKSRVEQLDALYARIPSLKCKGLCHDTCGPIAMTELERSRIRKKTHVELERNAVQAVIALGEFERWSHEAKMCPLLKDGRCSAYAIRPLICRLWGSATQMFCNHGCVPERWLSRDEILELFASVEAIGGRVE
jgi:Fe-S-cluster containining protein